MAETTTNPVECQDLVIAALQARSADPTSTLYQVLVLDSFVPEVDMEKIPPNGQLEVLVKAWMETPASRNILNVMYPVTVGYRRKISGNVTATLKRATLARIHEIRMTLWAVALATTNQYSIDHMEFQLDDHNLPYSFVNIRENNLILSVSTVFYKGSI